MINVNKYCANDNVYAHYSPEQEEVLMMFNAHVERSMSLFDSGFIAEGLAQLRAASAELCRQGGIIK